MKVLKFGGTSVGTARSLRNVKRIVEATPRPAVVVVSALGGITDMLIATGRMAEEGNEEGYLSTFENIEKRHFDVIDEVVLPEKQREVTEAIKNLLAELRRIYLGVFYLSDLSERVLNRIVSFGERMSSRIVAAMFPDITLLDSMLLFKTIRRHGKNTLDNASTTRLLNEGLADASRRDSLILLQGFISTDSNGDITNLGRGGSDYTAAIVAAHLNAGDLEIWTDVDGFLTADPRKIDGTRIIDHMSFVEAMDLCNFGAKVVYPPTIYPVFHKNIPVYIKNTFNPSAPGTRICDSSTHTSHGRVVGISSLPDTCLITINTTAAPEGKIDNNQSRVLNALARKGIDIFTVTTFGEQSSDRISFTLRNSEAPTATEELSLEFAPEIAAGSVTIGEPVHGLASIAIVGENMDNPTSLLSRIIDILQASNIQPSATAMGSTGSNLVVIVPLDCEREALSIIHRLIFNDLQTN